MSGIAGIYNLDGRPVDPQLLARMTDSLAFRGPDDQNVWVNGAIGFGHTLLRTTDEAKHEQQPYSLDGKAWITADARIDGRADLIRKLAAKGRTARLDRPDAELILHAYHAWGEACVEHLLGDFAFAIWDEAERKLFCARDHFGVKPFYYAQVHDCLVLSNTLNCVRMHPAVSDELNELAIADFLLFGHNQDSDTSTFSDIRRLPPAHSLTWSKGAFRLHRYWALPTDGQIRYKKASEYVEHFGELMRTSVADRLRMDRIWVWMSGGLDSTSIAAIAREQLARQYQTFHLHACTEVYDQLLPDNERYYATLAAKFLGIPIHYQALDNYIPFHAWDQLDFRNPEPSELCTDSSEIDELSLLEEDNCRVIFCGYGGDPALSSETFPQMLRCQPIRSLLYDAWGHICMHRRPPPLGIRGWLRRLSTKEEGMPYPGWLNEAFVTKLNLSARWQQVNSKPENVHRFRPRAYNSLTHPFWAYRFGSHDPGATRCNVEVRYPFFDRRLLDFLLAIPAIPWCADKMILREGMRGILPELVRLRPKTPLAGDPIHESLKQPSVNLPSSFVPASRLAEFIDVTAISRLTKEQDIPRLWGNIRALSLNHWFQSMDLLNKI